LINIIDFHAHAFPDKIAKRAVESLAENSGSYTPNTNGTIEDLLLSMKNNNIISSVIANIATKIEQFNPIMEWSTMIRSEKITPFISIHPDDPEISSRVVKVYQEGFKGIKLHSMYQNFSIDEEKMFPMYEQINECGLILLFHAGYDIGFGDNRKASVDKILRVHKMLKGLKIVASHMGGWNAWNEVEELIAGSDIWLETSFINEMPLDLLNRILKKHDPRKILFGTDSPWLSHQSQIEYILKLKLSESNLENIFYKNATDILKS